MTSTYDLNLPLTDADVQRLRAGDMVTLSGDVIITAGLPTHQRMLEFVEQGKTLPIDLSYSVLLQFGGYHREVDGKVEVVYMNPTTSTRFNLIMPALIGGLKLRAVGGKGGLDAACARAMRETGCIYLSFPGGGASLYSRAIRQVVQVEWRDFILHYRLLKLRVDRLGPGTVGIDAHGTSLYDGLQAAAEQKLPEIMAELNTRRDLAAHQAGASET